MGIVRSDEPVVLHRREIVGKVRPANDGTAAVLTRFGIVKVDAMDRRAILRELPHAGTSHADGLTTSLEDLGNSVFQDIICRLPFHQTGQDRAVFCDCLLYTSDAADERSSV